MPDSSHHMASRGAGFRFLVGSTQSAIRFLWSGDRRGGLLPAGDSLRRAWSTWWQVSLAFALVGGIVFANVSALPLQVLSAFIGVLGVIALLFGLWGYGAVAGTLPPPLHVQPPDPRFDPTQDEGGLVAFRDGIWVASVPLTFEGAPFGTRMTVLDTGEGLLVISPVQATATRLAAVAALGDVRWILAPNALHHLFVDGWKQAFPQAKLLASPGLVAHRDDITWDGTIGEDTQAPWPKDQVDTEVFEGHPWHREVVIYHRPTSTLIVSDLIENLGHDTAAWGRLSRAVLHLSGMWQRPGPPTDLKLQVRDRGAFAQSAARVADWAPDAIVLAHGPVITQGATEVWRAGFAYFMR